MTAIEATLQGDTGEMLKAHFDKQRALYLAAPNPDLAQRRQDLENLKRMINENREEIITAISQDYSNRSRHETQFAEIISVTDGINDVIKNLKKWMKVQKRHVDQTMFMGAKNRVIPQALGVVGIIVAMIVNFFLASSALQFAISVIGLLIFAGLTAYDTQRLKDEYAMVAGNGEAMKRASIFGALSLYLDFVNMFQFMLSLFGAQNE